VRRYAQGRPYETIERVGATDLATTVTLDVAVNAIVVTDL
jgi:hypothetical protein